jgi:hypothetical protein
MDLFKEDFNKEV